MNHLQGAHNLFEIRTVAAEGQKYRLPLGNTDPRVIHIDVDHRFSSTGAVNRLVLEADQERPPIQNGGYVVARPPLVIEEQVLIPVKAQDDMGQRRAGFRVLVEQDRILLVQLRELGRKRQGPIDIVAVPGAVAGIDLQVLVVDVIQDGSVAHRLAREN